MPAPSFVDIRDHPSPDQDSADLLVVAACLMTTDKRSVSALLNAAREPLRGEVEVMTRGLAASKPGCKGVGNSRTSGRHSF
jgi:hypothetical protein